MWNIVEQPPYFHSFNSGLFWVYQQTHYIVEPGAQKVRNENDAIEKIEFISI